MSELKLPAASGGGSISIKGPASSGSDVDLVDTSGNLKVTGTTTLDGKTGIGVTSPFDNSILHVKSSVAADYRPLVVEGSATNGSGVSIWNSGAQRIFVGSGGDNNVSGSSLTDGLVRAENNLQFAVGNSLKAEVQSGGDVKINNGDLVFGTAGKGICLGVTSNTDSNTLDDYEEGTFTPKLGGDNNYSTYNITGTGTYVKIGTWVHVTIRFNSQDLDNNASGNVFLYDMPFTSGNNPTNGVAGVTTNYETYGVDFSGSHRYGWYISGNTTNWRGLASVSGSAWSNWGIGDWDSPLNMDFSGSYRTG